MDKNSNLHNPIGDLVKEIADEEAAAAAKVKESEADEQTGVEEEEADKKPAPKAKEEPKEEEAKDDEPDEDKKPRRGFVPIGRLNETQAKLRKADSEREALAERVKELEEANKAGKLAVTDDDRKKITAQARDQARFELQIESFLESAYDAFGQKEFDEVSGTLVELGAPSGLVSIALEATGSPARAAKAIFNLGQEDPDEIEKIFKMSPIRMAAQLDNLAGKRTAKVKEEDDDTVKPKPKAKVNGKEVSRAPAPLTPVRGSVQPSEDSFEDELTDAQFTERFDKMMDKRAARRR